MPCIESASLQKRTKTVRATKYKPSVESTSLLSGDPIRDMLKSLLWPVDMENRQRAGTKT